MWIEHGYTHAHQLKHSPAPIHMLLLFPNDASILPVSPSEQEMHNSWWKHKVRGEQLLEELTGEAWIPLGDIFHVTVHSARNLCHHMVRQSWQISSKAESAGTLQLPSSLLSLLFGCRTANGMSLSPLLSHRHTELSPVPAYLYKLSLGWMELSWTPFGVWP